MTTISKIVEKHIKDHSFIQEALVRGILNYAAMAQQIKPEVEREMNQNVKESAIMMALRRHKENLKTSLTKKVKFTDESDVFIKSDLFEITFKKSSKINSLIREIYEKVKEENDFLTVTEGLSQVTLISNKRNKKKILNIMEKKKS